MPWNETATPTLGRIAASESAERGLGSATAGAELGSPAAAAVAWLEPARLGAAGWLGAVHLQHAYARLWLEVWRASAELPFRWLAR